VNKVTTIPTIAQSLGALVKFARDRMRKSLNGSPNKFRNIVPKLQVAGRYSDPRSIAEQTLAP
jgi:hypothetical protein